MQRYAGILCISYHMLFCRLETGRPDRSRCFADRWPLQTSDGHTPGHSHTSHPDTLKTKPTGTWLSRTSSNISQKGDDLQLPVTCQTSHLTQCLSVADPCLSCPVTARCVSHLTQCLSVADPSRLGARTETLSVASHSQLSARAGGRLVHPAQAGVFGEAEALAVA